MNSSRIYGWLAGLMLIAAGIFFIPPIIGVNELLYPLRVDSLYVKAQRDDYAKAAYERHIKVIPRFYYSPAQLGVLYGDFDVKTKDGILLKGWLIPSKEEKNAPVVLLIHDLNESRITMLDMARQLYDRGFAVCLMDMRAHGASEGSQSTLGYFEPLDYKIVLDSLYKQQQNADVVLFGTGMGAGVAIRLAVLDARPKVLIAQGAFKSLPSFVEKYAEEKWGVLNSLFFSSIRRKLEKSLGYNLDRIDNIRYVKKVTIPSLFIYGDKDLSVLSEQDTEAASDSVFVARKEIWTVQGTDYKSVHDRSGTDYFNKISIFIVQSIPKTTTKTRFRRFV